MGENNFELFSTSFSRIWKSLQKMKTRAMAPFGLKSAHVMCLFFLQQTSGGLTVSELAELSELDKGAVSRAAALLEHLGYAESTRPDEKRKYRSKIVLTEAGKTVSAEMNLVIDDAVRRAGLGMTEAERDAFEKNLSLIAANLTALAEE